MLRNSVMAILLGSAPLAVPAFAAEAPAEAAKGYSTTDSTIGTLLDDPATRAVLDKYLPGLANNPQIEMARGMTLRQIQQFAPDQIKEEFLAQIDVDLSKLPARK